ncbi:MAG: PDZ domain-containing protein [Phycisphaeraceae bacterium]|nr:PDZ domain-containing protein [Phycisphaeraceae bacterium]
MNQAINAFTAVLNPMGQAFWTNATGLFIQSTLLIVLLIITDLLLQKRSRAVFRYGLWMLLFAKLILPASFTLPTGIGYWVGDYLTPEVVMTKSVPPITEGVPMVLERQPGLIPLGASPQLKALPMPETPPTGVEHEPIDWQGLAFLGWLSGMLVLSVLLVKRACFVKRLVAQGEAADEPLLRLLDECRCRIGLRRSIELRLSDTMLSPAVCGLFRPVVLMPNVLLERLSPEKLKAVLMHELAHVKRADVWVNLLQTICQIVFFYNPLLWMANAMIRRIREQAVDEMVLVTLKSETKQYSNTLLDIAEMTLWRPSFSLGLIGVVESKKALERRIKHMLNRPVPKSSTLGIREFLAIIVIGAVLLPMGCQVAQKNHIPSTSTINEEGHIVDKTDYPFVSDSAAMGGWKSVDFVKDIKDFNPAKTSWRGDLYLNHLVFEEEGRIAGNFLTWTKGLVLSDDTASQYIIKEIDGSSYMFFEWKSGDYTIRHSRPQYYVLRKVPAAGLKHEPMFGEKASIPATSTINDQGHIVDKTDYPFVDDSDVIGTWRSVDYVDEMEQFRVGKKKWKGRGGKLFLHEMIFADKGRVVSKNDNAPEGYGLTWTKGLVISDGRSKKASQYTLKDMAGSTYMFYEWKSGDYTFRYRKPSYYVLKKVSSDTGGFADAWASQPSDAEFARLLPARIEQLDIDTASLGQVKAIFGKPAQYVWGKETFTEDTLPRQYILVYPSRFHIFMREDEIVEMRHEEGSSYVFREELRCGSTLDEVFDLLGRPEKTVEGEKNEFVDGILYRDIAGRKGHCYYGRSDQNVRLWFSDYKIIAIYMTCSDYGTWVTPKKAYLGIELNDQRWPLVDVIPDMPAAQAGIQNGDKILKVNDQDMSQTTTLRGALAALKCDPGDRVKLTIQRGEQILDFEVEPTDRLPARES